MRKLRAFNFISLNGCYKGANGDISWHRHGEEENRFSAESLQSGGGPLLFGRVTYEMMAGYWPTPFARENDPIVAEKMNRAEKIVFSRTLQNAEWSNTRVVKNNLLEEVKRLKDMEGKDLTLLGSGTILTQLAEKLLIDEYEIMVDPVVVSAGTLIFKDLTSNLSLKLIDTRTFKSGVVLLRYQNS